MRGTPAILAKRTSDIAQGNTPFDLERVFVPLCQVTASQRKRSVIRLNAGDLNEWLKGTVDQARRLCLRVPGRTNPLCQR